MSAVTVKDGLVHYEVFGRGPALILIHGWLGSWRYWIPTMQQLSAKYRTYALDLWGFGDSGKRPQFYSFEHQVELVNEFTHALGITKAAVVGHALGAAVAVRFATKHADLTARLMTVSLPLVGNSELSQRVTNTPPSSWVERLIDNSRPDYQAIDTEAAKADPEALRVSAEILSGIDWRPELGKLKVPTLIVHGERDPLVEVPPDEHFELLNNNIHRVLLNDSKHFPMLDEAPVFNRLLGDFLSTEDISTLEKKIQWKRRVR